MKKVLLKLEGDGKIPEALLREIRDSKEEIEVIFDAEEYDELFPIMQKLFDGVSLERIKEAKHSNEIRVIKKKKEDPQERRQIPRWQVNRLARLRVAKAQDFTQCTIEDLNLKGMRISMPDPLPQAQPLRVSLNLEENINLELEVQIPWARQQEDSYAYGLSFSKIKDFDKQRLLVYLNNNCSEQMKEKMWAW